MVNAFSSHRELGEGGKEEETAINELETLVKRATDHLLHSFGPFKNYSTTILLSKFKDARLIFLKLLFQRRVNVKTKSAKDVCVFWFGCLMELRKNLFLK